MATREQSPLRIIANAEFVGRSLPSFLSRDQEKSLREIESGFKFEKPVFEENNLVSKESPTDEVFGANNTEESSESWVRWYPFSPDGVRDSTGNVWALYYDETQKHKGSDAWQAYRCLNGEQEFGWVEINDAAVTEIQSSLDPEDPDYSPGYFSAQLHLRDGGQLVIYAPGAYRQMKADILLMGENVEVFKPVYPRLQLVSQVADRALAGNVELDVV